MKFVFVLLAAVMLVLACAAPFTEKQYSEQFNSFMGKYKKQYTGGEFAAKFAAFKANVDMIAAHNAKKGTTFKLGMNEFGDLTFKQFSARLSTTGPYTPAVGAKPTNFAGRVKAVAPPKGFENVKPPAAKAGTAPVVKDGETKQYNGYTIKKNAQTITRRTDGKPMPRAVKDWRKEGAVNPVRNQGDCASSWAFAASAAIEGALAVRYKNLWSISDKFLLDCSVEYGNKGCKGGSVINTLGMVWHIAGACQMKDYYSQYRPQVNTCEYFGCTHRLGIRKYDGVLRNDVSALVRAIDQTVVAATITFPSILQFYSSGVFSGDCASPYSTNVAIVGYDMGVEGDSFYVLRNSWGPSWGEGGYMRLGAKNFANSCGIASNAAYVSEA